MMKKSPFVLETDDGLGEDLNAAAKGAAGTEHGPPPLETPFQKEAPPSPRIRVNLNYRPGLVTPDDPNRFDRERIFQAVVAGDPELLNGLTDYLRKTSSFLTDTKYRDGKTGKTCLMKALLHLKDGKNPTIPELLKIDKETQNPKSLVNAACTGSYYKGHTALHIAIEKRNLDLVKILVENEADVHVKASGRFFQPHRKGAYFYFGELPLSLAACTNQPEVVMYLLDNPHQKARLTEQDSLGNTVLHALVMVANDTEKNTELVVNMYDMILMKGVEIDRSCKLEEIVNLKELTPLKLAAKTGKVEILKHMLHREMKDPKFQHLSRKLTEWTYGPVHISLYDLTSIDSCEENSVLEILAYSSNTPNRYKMVALEPLNKLLQHKWESFIRKRFFLSLFLHLIFMLIYTGTAYYRPLNGEPLVPTTVTFQNSLRLIGAVIVLIGGIYLFIAQSFYFWRRRFSWKSLLVDSCFEIFLFVQALAILASSVMFLANTEKYVLPMVFALLLGWVNMLYYSRGLQQMGIYIVMIQKAILRDLLHFLMVYVIFLFGFATALIILTGGASHPTRNASHPLSDDSKDQAVYSGLFQTALLLFKFTIGMGDLEYNENVKYSDIAMLMVLLFVILTYILLLNMLIALMSETVTNVSGYSQSVWQLQRAIAILEIEKNWIWCWKKAQRAGCYLSVSSEDKEDERWFFRVEEVNWEDWNEKLDTLKEDPMGSNLLEKDPSSDITQFLQPFMGSCNPRFVTFPAFFQQTKSMGGSQIRMLKYMLTRKMKDPNLSRKFIEWTYGPIQTSVYDMTSIDSREENSALEVLAYNSDIPNRTKIVGLEPLNKLLLHKWESFIKKRFYVSLFLHLTFMVIFTATAYHWPPKDEPLVPTVTFWNLLRLLGAVIVLIGGIYLFIAQIVQFWRRQLSLKSLAMDSCFDIFLFAQALNILVSSMMFFANKENYVVPMVFALLLGWVNLLYYTRGFQQIGISIVMIQEAVLRDLFHFLIAYFVLLFGFATALIVLTGGASHSARNASLPLSDDLKDQAVYSGPFQTTLLLFKFTIGMGDLEYHENLKHSYATMVMVLLFVILTYILLLNMLIALMSNTVTNVSKRSQSIWQLQRAITILEMEKNWIWCWKKNQRDTRFLLISFEDKKDERWFFRIEEVQCGNLTKKSVLREEPMETKTLEEPLAVFRMPSSEEEEEKRDKRVRMKDSGVQEESSHPAGRLSEQTPLMTEECQVQVS